MFSYLYSFTSDSNTGLLFMCADVHPYEWYTPTRLCLLCMTENKKQLIRLSELKLACCVFPSCSCLILSPYWHKRAGNRGDYRCGMLQSISCLQLLCQRVWHSVLTDIKMLLVLKFPSSHRWGMRANETFCFFYNVKHKLCFGFNSIIIVVVSEYRSLRELGPL